MAAVRWLRRTGGGYVRRVDLSKGPRGAGLRRSRTTIARPARLTATLVAMRLSKAPAMKHADF
jgi:hypothetical protein